MSIAAVGCIDTFDTGGIELGWVWRFLVLSRNVFSTRIERRFKQQKEA
jgi:hypothetical protein